MEKKLKGISLILFGILLTLAESTLNRTVFGDLGYLPFTLLGIVLGIVGVVLTFQKTGEK